MTRATRSTILLRQLGGLAVAALLAYWYLRARSVPDEVLSQRECEKAYQQARTLSDTLAIDLREPLMQRRGRGATATTCGSLRKAGRRSR